MTPIGFRPTNERMYRAYNVCVAATFLVISLPILLVLALPVLLTQGPSIFYAGERLGRNRKVFKIYKIRTLCSKRAAELTKDKTLPDDADIFTPLGRLLRETRMDELPQVFNVLKGDMNICGPRPVRAEIRDIHVNDIPDYDLRFSVKPGLLGPTQAYFGHGTSKSFRARMNNMAVRKPVSIKAELSLSLRIIGAMALRIGRVAIGDQILTKIFGKTRRDITLVTDTGKHIAIEKMDRKMLVIGASAPTISASTLFVRLKNGAVRRARINMTGPVSRGVYQYEASDDLSAYIVERYALNKVVVPAAVQRVKLNRKRLVEKVTEGARKRA